MSRAISLPHEHGAYLTLAGATIAGASIAHAHVDAAVFAVVLVAVFFARGSIEALAVGRPRPWDGLAVLVFATVAAAALGFLSRLDALAAALAAVFAAGIVGFSLIARIVRRHRTHLFEIAGMATMAASSGAVARVGGASLRDSLLLAIVLAAHATVAVPLVRAELRRRERVHAPEARAGAAIVLVGAATTLWWVGAPYLTLALIPRATLITVGTYLQPRRPAAVGIHETLALVATLALALETLRM
jgi:hypothetical protein